MIQNIKNTFIQKFSTEPFMVKSPGRVNLIGEHTDYNNGFVLPAAVNKAIYFAVGPNELNRFRFYAIDLDESFETALDQIEICSVHWANYLLGVIAQFITEGKFVSGFDCVFGGDVPLGAGMSSSAAIECGMAFAINHLQQFEYSRLQLAKFAQKAEHEYAGVQCGIMDQFASLHGKINQVIKLDCRSLEYELFPFDMTDYQLALVNTGVKHALASSEYNIRRQECEAGVGLMQKYFPEVISLRDANMEMIGEHQSEFPMNVYKRCSYIIEENQRVDLACTALQNSDFESFGQLMYQSHEGLKNKFEVSCPELNQLVDIASGIEGVIGARMMGGGFGGCTINLMEKNAVPFFQKTINQLYQAPDGNTPQIIEVVIEDGTRILSPTGI
ncbi:MAG: galactokinase [Bacteroidetes bacterium HGW-Bacteroidetes-16]|jgi:galactokinase|nr:MAG: galactokinase [Bacteroidetes bacterium HGW-Bacteroidetes-16]